MADVDTVTGRFVWHDLLTTDLDVSLEFYSRLFPEWSIQQLDQEQSRCAMISVGGRPCAALVPLDAESGLRSYWAAHIVVDNCETVVERAVQAGGRCVVPPVSVPGVGRTATLADEQGAIVKTFEPATQTRPFSQMLDGMFVRNELLTTDLAAAQRFYQSVFGWSVIERWVPGGESCTIFRCGSIDVATGVTIPSDADLAPAWLVHIHAGDVDERSRLAESFGSEVWVPPQDVAGSGRFCIHTDPAGAFFALFAPAVTIDGVQKR